MAVIDLTLESFLIPAIPNYVSNRFGTKKQSGGLSTQEVNDNMMMPWVRSRPIEISASSTTKASSDAKAPVQADCNFVFTAEQSVSFMLDDADYIGCRATFHNTSAYTQTVSALNVTDPNSPSYDTHTVLEGDRIVLVWNGTAWQNISPVDTVADGNMNPVTSNAVANNCVRAMDINSAVVTSMPSQSSGPLYQSYTATKDCWVTANIKHGGSTDTGDFVFIYNKASPSVILAGSSFRGYSGEGNVAGPIYLRAGMSVTFVWSGYSNSLSGRTCQYTIFGCMGD